MMKNKLAYFLRYENYSNKKNLSITLKITKIK